MAITSSTLVAGKAIGGRQGNGNDGRYGLKAKVAAGVAILGCAAALAFGGLRAGDGAQAPSKSAALAPITPMSALEQLYFLEQNLMLSLSVAPSMTSQQHFLEWNLILPDGLLPTASISVERQHFLATNMQLPDGTLPTAPMSIERQRFLELNTQLPDGGVVAPTPSGRSTYR